MGEDIQFELEEKQEEKEEVCESCGSNLIFRQGRCTTCASCGLSKCDL